MNITKLEEYKDKFKKSIENCKDISWVSDDLLDGLARKGITIHALKYFESMGEDEFKCFHEFCM